MAEQSLIDFSCDDRVPRLAAELAIVLAPHVSPGTKAEVVRILAERIAMLAERRLRDLVEPTEPLRCHCCDNMTVVPDRVRVAVCVRCALEPRSPGATG